MPTETSGILKLDGSGDRTTADMGFDFLQKIHDKNTLSYLFLISFIVFILFDNLDIIALHLDHKL